MTRSVKGGPHRAGPTWPDCVPRLGWLVEPSPLTAASDMARRLGLAGLFIKRDDLIPALGGGGKPRKLECLLAAEPWSRAPIWQAIGAVGSGHLVAMTEAAKVLNRQLIVHCFAQPVSAHVLQNLALTASGPTQLHFYRSRAEFALRHPRLLLRGAQTSPPTVPPGGTNAVGMLGFVRAGCELGQQIAEGLLPQPDFIYVALGTGGTAAGLSVGLGLCGVRTTIVAVSTIEQPLSTQARLRALQREVLALLRVYDPAAGAQTPPCPITIDRSQLGRGYGHPTPRSLAAVELSSALGVRLESVYTGKTFAGLLAAADRLRGKNVLYWHTARGDDLKPRGDWQARLPVRLQRTIGIAATRGARRRFLLAGVIASGASVFAYHRFGHYEELSAWDGIALSERQARVVMAAAEVLVPLTGDGAAETSLRIAHNVDRYVAGLPGSLRTEIFLLLLFVEQATWAFGHLGRFTRLSVSERDAVLRNLATRSALTAQAYRGLRDLCMLGYYQLPAAWPPLGYGGPWAAPPPVASGQSAPPPPAPLPAELKYRALLAADGQVPDGVLP